MNHLKFKDSTFPWHIAKDLEQHETSDTTSSLEYMEPAITDTIILGGRLKVDKSNILVTSKPEYIIAPYDSCFVVSVFNLKYQ